MTLIQERELFRTVTKQLLITNDGWCHKIRIWRRKENIDKAFSVWKGENGALAGKFFENGSAADVIAILPEKIGPTELWCEYPVEITVHAFYAEEV